MCNRDLSRVNGGLSRVLFLYTKEECRMERTLGHSYGYWVPLEVKSLMQVCPYSDLCLVFAAQREGGPRISIGPGESVSSPTSSSVGRRFG